MFVLLYFLEELSDDRCYGYNWSTAAPFNDSEKGSSDPVHRNWFGPSIIKREIHQGILQRN